MNDIIWSPELLSRHHLGPDPVSGSAGWSIGDISAISDGFIVTHPEFIGLPEDRTIVHRRLAGADGEFPAPIGCFLLQRDRTYVFDLGYGPNVIDTPGLMVGGRLLDGLAEHGVAPADIDVIALSHLHPDHVGWLADRDGSPIFANARIVLQRAEWEQQFFSKVPRRLALADHQRTALLALDEAGQVTFLDGTREIGPGVTAIAAPGHTPGHQVFEIDLGEERLLLLGDAAYCAEHLGSPEWQERSDFDPALAQRTRRDLVAHAAERGARVVACHFHALEPVSP